MMYFIQNVCKKCQNLQTLAKVQRKAYYQIFNKPTKLRTFATSYPNHDPPLTEVNQLWQNGRPYQDLIGYFENIQCNIFDKEVLNDLEERLMERDEEMNKDISQDEEAENISPKKIDKKKLKGIPSSARYEHGNQLTSYGEKSILAELDIYMYLGEFTRAHSLFAYHRRRGHHFCIDAYNKMIHIWAAQKNWENIRALLVAMQKEDKYPNYQTYAGQLEACGNIGIKTAKHITNILNEMAEKNMDIKELLRESQLTKQQIASIFKALDIVNQNCFTNKANLDKSAATGDINLIQAQIDLELKGSLSIKSVETLEPVPASVLKRSDKYQNIIETWKKDFVVEMRKAQQSKKNNDYNRCFIYGSVLSPEELSDIVCDLIVPEIAIRPSGVHVHHICRLLGHIIYARFCSKFQESSGVAEKVKRITEEFYSPGCEDEAVIPRLKWNEISNELQHLPSESLAPFPWTKKIQTKAAGAVLDILKKVATVDIKGCAVRSLYHQHDAYTKYKIGVLKFHPAICRLYKSTLYGGEMQFAVTSLPMVIPPQPWHAENGGGYLLSPTSLIREQRSPNNLCGTSDKNGLDKLYDALNHVGNCEWKVNGKLLDIMIELFNGKGDTKLDVIGKDLIKAENKKEKESLKLGDKKERLLIKRSRNELFSLYMELLYRLSVANHFRDNVLWIPHNLDFRGRIYPIAPHLSHNSNDLSRSMLMFNKGKKLGEKGFDWLKVHLVNVSGKLKKASLKERVEYVDKYMEDIQDSADYPLPGRKWWKDSSDPWQTLAACMEVTNAVRSGDPKNFVSHLPIQQDGSCNGLQHYAALGRDSYGAKQVNLKPGDRPQDLYQEVSTLVEKKRRKDAENGVVIAQQLDGKINRKVVKQTVMTIVYGVTLIGGRLQIEKQLKDLGVDNDIIFKASFYLVQELFKALAEMFTSAREIQDWLTLSAAKIALTGNCVEWVTPLNLLVSQPYHKETQEHIITPLQKLVTTHMYDYTQVPNLSKQKGAFPPNFIHSLDSTHMMMTALRCQEEKMVFTSVHDSFWTHGCDVDHMNRFCREEFIRLHKLPILEDLKKYFDEKFSGKPLRKALKDGSVISKFNDLPQKGSFDIDEVQNSVYFFS